MNIVFNESFRCQAIDRLAQQKREEQSLYCNLFNAHYRHPDQWARRYLGKIGG